MRPVAVKQQPVQRHDLLQFKDEMRCHERIGEHGGHPHVLHVRKHCYDPEAQKAVLIMDCGIFSLHAFLITQAYHVAPEMAKQFAHEMAMALEFLHQLKIIHRDLKPANVILCLSSGQESGLTCKIADFGCARLAEGRPQQSVGFCTSSYRAPEATQLIKLLPRKAAEAEAEAEASGCGGGGAPRGHGCCETGVGSTGPAGKEAEAVNEKNAEVAARGRYSTAADIWSYGCMLCELALGRVICECGGQSELRLLSAVVQRIGPWPQEAMQIEGWTADKLEGYCGVGRLVA